MGSHEGDTAQRRVLGDAVGSGLCFEALLRMGHRLRECGPKDSSRTHAPFRPRARPIVGLLDRQWWAVQELRGRCHARGIRREGETHSSWSPPVKWISGIVQQDLIRWVGISVWTNSSPMRRETHTIDGKHLKQAAITNKLNFTISNKHEKPQG